MEGRKDCRKVGRKKERKEREEERKEGFVTFLRAPGY